jgi:hypothetical protein
MAYLKITDVSGIEYDLQVLDEDRNILISKEFGRFIPLEEFTKIEIGGYEDKISDLESDVEDAKDAVIDAEDEAFVYKERAEEWENKYNILLKEHS